MNVLKGLFGDPIFKAYKYIVILKMLILKMHNMIFPLLCCFPTLTSKHPKGRFVALRFIYKYIQGAREQRYSALSLFAFSNQMVVLF